MAGTSTSASSGTQAIDRAALLVATVVKADVPLTFGDVQEECGLPKSTTSRLLTALERTELIERNADGRYVAGPLFWLYATRHDPWEELVRLARPTLLRVGEAVGETVNLAVVRGDRLVQVDQVDTTFLLGARDWTEVDDVPDHATATGKVMLAHGVLRAGIASESSALEAPTPRTVTDRDELRLQLARVVRQGWASTVDELEIGLAGVAAPVRGGSGQVVAALGVSGPTARIEGQVQELGALLVEEAARLSRLLRRRNRNEGVA